MGYAAGSKSKAQLDLGTSVLYISLPLIHARLPGRIKELKRQKFDIPDDVEVAYCHESEIALHRGHGTTFFPLMAILEGGVKFPVDPLLVSTLRYYGLCPD